MDANYLPTKGVEFKLKTCDLNGKIFKTKIWDSAGQSRYSTIISSYYKGNILIL